MYGSNRSGREVALSPAGSGGVSIGIWNTGPLQWSAFAVSLLAYASFVSLHHRGLPLVYRNRWQLLLDICNVLFLIYFMLWYLLPPRTRFTAGRFSCWRARRWFIFRGRSQLFVFIARIAALHNECLDCGSVMSAEQPDCPECRFSRTLGPARNAAKRSLPNSAAVLPAG